MADEVKKIRARVLRGKFDTRSDDRENRFVRPGGVVMVTREQLSNLGDQLEPFTEAQQKAEAEASKARQEATEAASKGAASGGAKKAAEGGGGQ